MKDLLRTLLGANGAALAELARFRPRAAAEAARRAYSAARIPPTDPSRGVPGVWLGDILGAREVTVQLTVTAASDGALPPEQAVMLLAILLAEQPATVLEIGTFMGTTTRRMAEAVPGALVHTVDLPEDFDAAGDRSHLPKDDLHLIQGRRVGRDYRGQPCAARIRQHFADTATWDFRAAGRPDFFFIDGSHTYEHCRSDSEKCLEVASDRAVFLWHDCDGSHPGVERFVGEWRGLGRDVRRIHGSPLAYWKRGT